MFLVCGCAVAAEMRNKEATVSPLTLGVFIGGVLSMVFFSILTAFRLAVFS